MKQIDTSDKYFYIIDVDEFTRYEVEGLMKVKLLIKEIKKEDPYAEVKITKELK